MRVRARTNRRRTALLVTAIIVAAGLIVGGYFWYAAQQASSPKANDSQPSLFNQNLERTDEKKVEENEIDSYKVAADLPRVISIPKIKVNARVLPMGLNPDNSIQAPINIHDAGWYNGSAKPNQQGAVFIDAHASGSTRKGLFAYLDTLTKGDKIAVELGSGQNVSYTVQAVETTDLNKVDMKKVLAVYPGSSKSIAIMTCTGDWVESKKTFTQRFTVYATQD